MDKLLKKGETKMLIYKTGDILQATENIICHQEIWKDIKNYEGLYQISNFGRVKSLPRKGTVKHERILKQCRDKYGYLQVILNNKTHKSCRIHKLVAQEFIPNPENKLTVNHKNGNKYDNKVENLEWNTIKENNDNAIRIGLNKTRKIIQYDKNMKFIKKWNSSREIERDLNYLHSNILACCNGIYKTMYGYVWRFENVNI